MTARDAAVRRALARICSARTMERLVDPILSDMQVESARGPWRGYATLACALVLYSVDIARKAIAIVWAEEAPAAFTLIGYSVCPAILLAAILVLPPILGGRNLPDSRMAISMLALPQALAITLPAGLLFGLPMALSRRQPSRREMTRTLFVALLSTAVTLVLFVTVAPFANQWSPLFGAGQPRLRGSEDWPLAALARQIRAYKEVHGAGFIVAQLRFEYHAELAALFAAFPLSLLSLGLWRTTVGQRHPLTIGSAGVGGYVALMFWERLVHPAALVNLPTPLVAWTPDIVLACLAVMLLASPRGQPIITAPPASA
jgi:hypothetical protein